MRLRFQVKKLTLIMFSVMISMYIETGLANTPSPCFDMEKEIPCGSQEFPRQAGDYPIDSKDPFEQVAADIIYDKYNKLFWMRCSYPGANGNNNCLPGSKAKWHDAYELCNNLQLGNKQWRLPSIMELNSLLDLSRTGVKINSHYFPGSYPYNYWSSTDSLTSPKQNKNQAWHLNFKNGFIFDDNKESLHYFRCVSDSK